MRFYSKKSYKSKKSHKTKTQNTKTKTKTKKRKTIQKTIQNILRKRVSSDNQEGWKIPTAISSQKNVVRTFIKFNSLRNLSKSKLILPIYFKDYPQQIEDWKYDTLFSYYPYLDNTNDWPDMSEILPIYNYANNILITHVLELCIKKAGTCFFKSYELKSRVSHGCCGFIAPALGVVLQFANFQKSREPSFKNIDFAILAGLNFYTRFAGYGNSPYGWNKNCNKFTNFIKEGVNIFSFFDRKDDDFKNCDTTHHFIVYKKRDYCLIIDAWTGRSGMRGPWARIMRSVDLIHILKTLTGTTSLSITNKLLNAYFMVPHAIDITDNINDNITNKLISAGAYNLIDWKKQLESLHLQGHANMFVDFSSDGVDTGIDPVTGSPIIIGPTEDEYADDEDEDEQIKDNSPLTWVAK